MRREVFWLMAAVVAIVFAVGGVDGAWAQEVVDPAPSENEPELAGDLPLPEHSLVVTPPPRDMSRPFFGVTFDPLVRDGAVARSVSAGSPADVAGVRAGDTIISVNGRPVGTLDDVLNTVARLKPGDVLDVEITRRVSVRARAVLEGAPAGFEHTTSYHTDAESLPVPAGIQIQPPLMRAPADRDPAIRPPANVYGPRPQQGNNGPQNRNSNVNRGNSGNQRNNNANQRNNSNDRDQDNRRGGFRRGRR